MSRMDTASLITDSSARIPGPWEAVTVLPVVIHLSGEQLPGDATGVAVRVYEALHRHEPVKSSAPTVLEYLDAIEASPAPTVVVVTPAAEFTGMFQNASVAAELSGRDVRVVDSRSAAAAHGLVVRAAAGVAAAGGTADDVVLAAEGAARRSELVAALDGLDYIRRSGRVPAAAVEFAKHLGVRPVFRLHSGVVERLAVPRSREGALARVIREARRRGVGDADARVVFHAADPERASLLQRALRIEDVSEFSPSMGIHTGPGVVGVAWLAPDPSWS
jgi:DegV family protein with EDD domain